MHKIYFKPLYYMKVIFKHITLFNYDVKKHVYKDLTYPLQYLSQDFLIKTMIIFKGMQMLKSLMNLRKKYTSHILIDWHFVQNNIK